MTTLANGLAFMPKRTHNACSPSLRASSEVVKLQPQRIGLESQSVSQSADEMHTAHLTRPWRPTNPGRLTRLRQICAPPATTSPTNTTTTTSATTLTCARTMRSKVQGGQIGRRTAQSSSAASPPQWALCNSTSNHPLWARTTGSHGSNGSNSQPARNTNKKIHTCAQNRMRIMK